MDELYISYGEVPHGKKVMNIAIGAYLAVFTLYFCIVEGIANRFEVLFFCSLIGFAMAAALILSNTLWTSEKSLKINDRSIEANLPFQIKMNIEWTSISKVNIGISYITFFTDGGKKQRKLDISGLVYEDMKATKSKVIELCGYKNISYQND